MTPEAAARAATAFGRVVRAIGILRPDTTPCGMRMSLTHAHALGELADGPLRQRELGARLRLEKSSVSRLVDELSRAGLAARRPHPADARSHLVALTDDGSRRAARLAAARADLFGRLLEAVPADRRAELVRALELLADAADAA